MDGSFRDASRTWTAQTELALDPQAPYRVSVQGGLRRRDVTDVFRRTEQRRETESVLMRIDGRARPLDRAVDARLFYDAATERTPIQREVYVQTSPERGQYVWRDANDDGVQQVDEFVPETTPNEGTYVQRFVPSDTLESVVDLQLRTRLALRPRRLWPDGDAWWKKGLRRVTAETRVQVREQSRTDNPTALYRLDPDEFRRPGRTTDGSLRLEQRLEVFRTQREYGLDASWRQVRGLTERAAGGERRFLNRVGHAVAVDRGSDFVAGVQIAEIERGAEGAVILDRRVGCLDDARPVELDRVGRTSVSGAGASDGLPTDSVEVEILVKLSRRSDFEALGHRREASRTGLQ